MHKPRRLNLEENESFLVVFKNVSPSYCCESLKKATKYTPEKTSFGKYNV